MHAPPPFTRVTITYKAAVYAPAEGADTIPLFSPLLLHVLCGKVFSTGIRTDDRITIEVVKTFGQQHVWLFVHCGSVWQGIWLVHGQKKRSFVPNLGGNWGQ